VDITVTGKNEVFLDDTQGALVRADLSEELNASIIRVTNVG
jgi:hypothetical protein